MKLFVLCCFCGLLSVHAFLLNVAPPHGWFIKQPYTNWQVSVKERAHEDAVDVEFERIYAKEEPQVPPQSESSTSSDKSLLDLSLESSEEWKDIRIPFVDPRPQEDGRHFFIDVRLAFMTELDGVQYGIGVPCDEPAAITFEDAKGRVVTMPPDDDENEEIMEIMAAHLKEHVSEDLDLKRTPRILTIAGDLKSHVKNWESELVPPSVDKDVLLDDEDESSDFFDKFMREELGEEEYLKTLKEAETSTVDESIAKFFDIPGLGDQADDLEGMEDLMESLFAEEQLPDFIKENLDHDGVALKLISFAFPDGKAYSLVHLLKPYTLVAKFIPSQDGKDMQFELLKPEEEKLVVPKLEEICQRELESAGISLLEP